MNPRLILLSTCLAMCACTLTPDQEAWNKAHHVGEINWTGTPGVISTSPSYPFNDKDFADPHPHSDSDDAQRAAYIQNQQEQRAQQSSGPDMGMPDLSKMNCAGSSTIVQGANAGMMTSSTSCHN